MLRSVCVCRRVSPCGECSLGSLERCGRRSEKNHASARRAARASRKYVCWNNAKAEVAFCEMRNEPDQWGRSCGFPLDLDSKLLDGDDHEPGYDPVLNRGEAVLVSKKTDQNPKHGDSNLMLIEVALGPVNRARVDTWLMGT